MKRSMRSIAAAVSALLLMMSVPANVAAQDNSPADREEKSSEDSSSSLSENYTGKTRKGGKYYYYKNGVRLKSRWITSNGKKKYYALKDGTLAVGNVTIGGIEYEFDENGVLVPEKWGIDMTVSDVTPTGCTVTITQSGGEHDGELNTGEYYLLERYMHGEWHPVEYIPGVDEVCWFDEAYELGENTYTAEINWEKLYGTLPAGKYRIDKEITNWRAPGDFDQKEYHAYFEIGE